MQGLTPDLPGKHCVWCTPDPPMSMDKVAGPLSGQQEQNSQEDAPKDSTEARGNTSAAASDEKYVNLTMLCRRDLYNVYIIRVGLR